MHPIDVVHLPEAVRAALREGPLALEAPPPVLDRADATDPQLPAFAAGAADAGQAEDAPPARPLRPLTAEEERHKEELLLLVRDHKGNVTTMARALNKARMQVQRWLKRYGIDPGEYRRG
jgi:transcriptional regulator of acetoin/glycerol metabolism